MFADQGDLENATAKYKDEIAITHETGKQKGGVLRIKQILKAWC